MKRLTVYHTYGTDDDKDDDEMTGEESTRVFTTKHSSASATRGKCKCGSSEHRYTSHRLCPLNKKKQVSVESDTSSHHVSSNSDTKEEISLLFSNCGSDRATLSRSCPLNPRNTLHTVQGSLVPLS